MTNLRRLGWPKPPRRKPKPPKRIKRTSLPKRRSPLPKRSPRRGEVEKADREWALKVKERDREACQFRAHSVPLRSETTDVVIHVVLPCVGGLDGHHIYSKGAHPRLRYDLDNGLTLCRGHHQYAHTAEGKVYVQRWLYSVHCFRWHRLGEKAGREARLS